MRRHLLSFALCAPLVVASAAHAERHYDCSKPGNANKAVCKTAAVAPAAQTAPMAAPAPAVTATASTSTRHYDCTKPGNANKAACKTTASPAMPAPAAAPATARAAAPMAAPAARSMPAATPAAPAAAGTPRVVAWTEKNGKVVHYDCSKRGNLNKQACKTS